MGALLVMFSVPALVLGTMGWLLHFVPVRNRDYTTSIAHGALTARFLDRSWRALLVAGATMAVAGILLVYLA